MITKIVGVLECSGACLRCRWKDDGRDTLVDPPPQLLILEVAHSAAAPARVVRIPEPSRPWVHLYA